MTNAERFQEWCRWTGFSLQLEIARAQIFLGIMNNLRDPDIQWVINWEGPRSTCESSGYSDVCENIANRYSALSSFCSHSGALHEMFGFVSEAICFLADQNKALQLQIKTEQIKKLRAEISKLEESAE